MKKLLSGLLIVGILLTGSVLSQASFAVSGGIAPVVKYYQTIQVAKSGANLKTITSALNSITDASASKPYCIQVFPGIYNESVTMKAYVDLVGVDRDSCIITRADATVVTMASNSSLSNLTVSLSNSTAARNIITDNGAATTNISINNVVEKVTGNYAHIGIYLAVLAGSAHTNIYVDSVTINCVALMTGIQFGSGNHSQSGCYVTNSKVFGGAIGIQLSGRDATPRGCLLNVKDVYSTSTIGAKILSTSSSLYLDMDLYNCTFTGNVTLTSIAGTDTVTLNAYNSSFSAVVKSAGGGTETFNSYGSIIGSTTFGNTYATTPELYALGSSFAAGSIAYVTSAKKLYMRATTWEAITSVP